MGILTSLKKGIEEGKKEQQEKEEEEALDRRVKAEERKDREKATPPSPVGKVIGRVIAGKPGRVVGKVANAGAQTIGKAVVVGGAKLKVAAKQGLENYAVNTGTATRKKGKVVRNPGASMLGSMGISAPARTAGNPMMIGAGLSDDMFNPPRCDTPAQKKNHRKSTGGGNIRGPLMSRNEFFGSVLHQETEMSYNEYTRERKRVLRRDRRRSPPRNPFEITLF